MTRIADLAAAGDPVDPDLVSLLDAEGVDTLDAIRTRGRDEWIGLFADREGFTRDFVEYPAAYGHTWESAAEAPQLSVDPYECEIGVAAQALVQKLGATTFADVFRHPREEVRAAMAERGGLFGELEDLVARHGGW